LDPALGPALDPAPGPALDPAPGPALDPAPGPVLDLAPDPAPGPAPDPGAGAADAVAGLLLAEIDRGAGEPQIALRGGDRFAARLRPGDDAGGGARLAVPAAPCVALETRQPGILDELYLAPAERPRPGRGEIELEVIAAGVNFRDVMNALGTYPGGPEPFGGECAGRITAIGDGVTGLRIGDEVVAGLVRGAFRTFVIADVQFVARKPVWLSFAEIAAIPIGFLTAEYALRRLARLVRGERVLIHAGAGGVGTAAIQLALELGAEVFATAGSPSKRAFVRSLGVRHVMDSRSLAFADQIRDATGGEGVDVVLSSLAGEFVTRSLGLVRRGGRFVEIGKIHVLDPTADPSAVPPGIAYFHFDLGEECARQPGLWQDMFGRVLGSLEAGRIRLPPVQRFEIAEAPAAFRAMAQGHHLGKLVLDLARPGAPRALALDPHGAYLVTGGLGGLGLRVARWLVERGAGRVAVLGRQPPSDAARRALAAIDPDATRVIVLAGDVARAADVEAAVRAIERTLPLRGVFHAAGVLADRTLAHQTWDDFAPVLAGKALGALHLHRATRAHRLDCFVLFSSLTSILGAAGQANYAAANAVLDSLAHHRRALGLPALVVNWGAFRDVGMAAADPARRLAPLAQLGIDAMSADEGIAALEAVIATRATQVGVVPVDWATYATRLGDRASPLVAALAQARRRGAGRTAAPAARVVSADQIAGVVAAEIRYVLNLGDDDPIAGDVPLAQLGLDSLIAVELRNRLGRLVHASLPPTLLFDYPTFDRLAGFLRGVVGAPAAPPVVAPVVASVVAPMVAPAPTAAPAAAADRITEILSAIAALSEDEQQRLVETLFAKEP
ncbi:MAG TPA: SDR family NAD(P)-dependent oxidoreductase, partial [Kofleriaceae bacterium]|nr:SDR family NAD(P)-dependent oxidoreductase [Kofleriaceae bacterium]